MNNKWETLFTEKKWQLEYAKHTISPRRCSWVDMKDTVHESMIETSYKSYHYVLLHIL